MSLLLMNGNSQPNLYAVTPNDATSFESSYSFSDVVPLYGKNVTVLESQSPQIRQHELFIYDVKNQSVYNDCDQERPATLKNPRQLESVSSRVAPSGYIQQVHGITQERPTKDSFVMTTSNESVMPSVVMEPYQSPYSQSGDSAPFPNEDETVPKSPEPQNTVSPAYVTHEELANILGVRQPSDGLQKGRFTFTPYGFINVSTSYETERTVNGDYALYSRSPDLDGGGHSGFHVDPKSSRLGLKIGGPDVPWQGRCVKTSALFEVDFQGNINSTRNRPGLMLRRAFVDFTKNDTRLLIGQEWEIISPLVPQSLNYVPGSCAGNLGYRRAQIRLEKTRDWTQDFSTIWQFAICDNIPDNLDIPGANTANAGWPMLQGRVAASFWKNPHADCQPMTLGVSGHVGEMRYDYLSYNIDHRKHETWSANIDLVVPVTKKLQLSGEIYTGVNLASSLGGIMQGVDFFSPGSNQINPRSAKASGGWGNITYKMTKKLHLNTGYTIEDMPEIIGSAHLGGGNYAARTRNQILYLNGVYHWTDFLMTGIEVSQWKTDWHNYNTNSGVKTPMEPGETTRIDFLVRYTF